MEEFSYKAYDHAGALHQGRLPALNLESARFKLKEQGLIPVSIATTDNTSEKLKHFLEFNRKPGLADLEFVTSQFSLLLKNGVKVDRAFEITKKSIRNRKFRKIIGSVHEDIRKGIALSEALGKYPTLFDPLYVSIVKIGEATGNLADAFADISANLGFTRDINSKTIQALIYPSVILITCVAAVLFIFNFIVPKFSVIFAGINKLPIYTSILLNVSAFFRDYQVVMGIALLAAIVAAFRLKGSAWFQSVRDSLILKIPLLENLCKIRESLRFTSAMAVLLKSGVVLSDALDHAVRAVGNRLLQKRLSMVKREVRKGGQLSETLKKTGFIPEDFEGLIEVGEQTGNLTEIFAAMESRLKTIYENRIKNAITLIEPIMIIVMGLVVGTVVVVMLLSMVSINDISNF